MSNADSKDGATTDALAQTMDSGARAVSSADSAADTQLAPEGDSGPRDPRPASPDELIGTTLSERYEVTAKLGQGGMGAVYEAKHTLIGKRVALKVLLDKHAQKDQVVARLKQEARLASSIGHDNIVDITDFGTTIGGRTFVVMEYLDGESLGACIARMGRLAPERVLRIAAQIASALAAAHEKGIVHRDIKPDNIFLIQRDNTDFVKVVDFGISKSMTPDEDESVRLTQTGMVLGTPLYMSPEQAQGEDDLDHRIDIYALGVILYEAITGEVPFQGKNYLNILTQVIGDEPKAPSAIVEDLDRDLESVILKSMAKDREQRYQTMGEFLEDLNALSDPDVKSTGARITAARWRKQRERRSRSSTLAWAGGILGIAAVSTVAVTMLMRSGESKVSKAEAREPEPKIVEPAIVTGTPEPVDEADAAPKEPAFVRATIKLVSKPPGATVYRDARQVCAATPCEYRPPKTGEQIQLRVELEGYTSDVLRVTPELDDGETLPIQLKPIDKKRIRRLPPARDKNQASGSDGEEGKNPKPRNSAGSGDVMGNPHRK